MISVYDHLSSKRFTSSGLSCVDLPIATQQTDCKNKFIGNFIHFHVRHQFELPHPPTIALTIVVGWWVHSEVNSKQTQFFAFRHIAN